MLTKDQTNWALQRVPREAREDHRHEFWGPSPDVRVRNFADPLRTVARKIELGHIEDTVNFLDTWRATKLQEKKELQQAAENAEPHPRHARIATGREKRPRDRVGRVLEPNIGADDV